MATAHRGKGDTINLKVGAMGLPGKVAMVVRPSNKVAATAHLANKDMVRHKAVTALPDKGMAPHKGAMAHLGNKDMVRLSNRVVVTARPVRKGMVRHKGATARLGNKATVRPDKAAMEARPKGVVMVRPGNKATVHLRGAMARLGKVVLVPDPVGLGDLSAHGLAFRADAPVVLPAEVVHHASCWCPRS